MKKEAVIKGLVLIFLAIIFGAFGAHKLKEILSVSELASFNTGVRYQMYGGFFLLILGLNSNKFLFPISKIVTIYFVGVLLFSTSIYSLTVFNIESLNKFIGPITPIGGLLMIVSVGFLLYKLAVSKSS